MLLNTVVLTSLAMLLLVIGEEVVQGVLWCFSVLLLLLRGENKPAGQIL